LTGSPACILLDVQMAGLNGLQLQDQLSALGCRLPIIFISAYGDIPTTVQTIKAGAEDFLTKPVTRERLVEVLERALARHEAIQAHDDEIATLQLLFGQLTPREREVLTLVAAGMPNKSIARRLEISEKTVKAHLTSVFRTIGVTDRTQAALWAERHGLGGS
jgi:RNA polymerase sigma factor (sigma-70 family)